jgi:hypothetical protein
MQIQKQLAGNSIALEWSQGAVREGITLQLGVLVLAKRLSKTGNHLQSQCNTRAPVRANVGNFP